MSATLVRANGSSPYQPAALASASQAAVGAATAATIAITATTGTLPTAAVTQTIADAATPTVAELLALCVSLSAQNTKLIADNAAIRTLVNQLRSDLVSLEAIKGAA